MDYPHADVPEEQPLLITDDLLEMAPRKDRIDFEKGISYCPIISLLLIAANVGVFVWEVARGALANGPALIAAGALNRPDVMRGEYWRLLSSVFLHSSTEHLLSNCAALYVLGMATEHAFGARQTLVIYLLSGLAGSLLSVFLESGPTVGASGAIFGFMGCTAAFLHRYRHRYYLRDARVVVVLLAWAVFSLATGWFNPRIANMAHLGGLVAGSALALVFRPRQCISA